MIFSITVSDEAHHPNELYDFLLFVSGHGGNAVADFVAERFMGILENNFARVVEGPSDAELKPFPQ